MPQSVARRLTPGSSTPPHVARPFLFFTVLGWQVEDISDTAEALAHAGVTFERYAFLEQDVLGIWSAPGGGKIAWFKDPDGNVLSLAQL